MTQDSTMALGADFISDLFETPNTLAHKGVKGMKFVKDDINLEIEHSNLEGGDMSGASEELVAVDSMDEILAHYGILGMKWGVRNDDRGSGRPQGGPSKKKAPLASVKKSLTKSPASTEEIVNKFYAKHTPKPMEFSLVDSATGKRSFHIKYDEKILKRMPDQQNHAVFESQKGVPDEVAKREMEYIKSQMKAASEGLDAKTPETENTTQNNRISDDELRAAINRLQMEKTYKQLMAERNPPAPQKAESAIKKILRDSTRQAAGELLKGTFVVLGRYAMAAAVAKSNPYLANSILQKNAGNWETKKEEDTSQPKTKSPKEEDTSQPKTKSPQNGSQTPKSNLGIKEADDHINKVAAKITDDFMATMPKASSTSNEAGKSSSSTKTEAKSKNPLDLDPLPEQDHFEKVKQKYQVEEAYKNASENYLPDKILEELYKIRKQ